MPSDISERTLGEVALISSGKRPTAVAKERSAVAAVPVVGGGGTSGYTEMPLTVEPVLITGRVGTLGKLHVSVGPVWPSDNALVIRPRPELISFAYLRYALGSVIHLASGMNRGAANPLVTQSDLSKLPIQIPSRTAQAEISSLLASLDDRIDLLRQTNATLESIAQALFKSWFIDFDPVRAKAEGREPEGMDAATAALFPSEFEESALGLIPKGWKVGRVADLGSVVCGKTPPTANAANYGTDVPFVTIPDMHGKLVVTETARLLSSEGANSQAKKYLPAGSVLVSCIATPGLVVTVDKISQTNQQINAVLPSEPWGGAFTLFTLQRVGDAVRMGGAGGSVFANLSKSGFEQVVVLLPAQTIAAAFNTAVEPLVKAVAGNQRSALVVSDLRDTLLPRLISGKLRLPEAQAQFEEAIA